MKKDKLKSFSWYGGKYSHLDWLLPLIPYGKKYIEPFGGSGSVLINRRPSEIDVYNDIDPDLINFFTLLRDDFDSLTGALSLSPSSREEFYTAVSTPSESLGPIDSARLFYLRTRMARSGLAQVATLSYWKNSIASNARGMAATNSLWESGKWGLKAVSQRMQNTVIENGNALDLIERYDSEDAVIYCDPPYIHDSRVRKNGYILEMEDSDHRDFGEVLGQCKARIAVSGYDGEIMKEILPYGKWKKILGPEKNLPSSHYTKRTEVLWTNYDPATGKRL